MNPETLHHLFDLLVTGEITPVDHATLQQTLKEDANARSAFRERMDLEAGLRTWAADPSSDSHRVRRTSLSVDPKHGSTDLEVRRTEKNWLYSVLALAAGLLLIAGLQFWSQRFVDPGPGRIVNLSNPMRLVGAIRQQEDCQWSVRPASASGRFGTGKLGLSEGVAQLSFDSATDVTLQGPCEIEITSVDSARILSGSVCVNVNELSSGFTLETPESQIIDEGTEYAVSIDEESTEVHVFDGRVIWIPKTLDAGSPVSTFEDRIEAGQAKSYLRSEPTKAKRIPFGKRQFVHRLEDKIKEQAGGRLIAYDGFENLAGRVRQGRSGFGWSDGWQPIGRGRGSAGQIVDCDDEVVFGFDRSQRRWMLLEPGLELRRSFDRPLNLVAGGNIFVSLLITQKDSSSQRDGASLQVSLEPDLPGRGRRLHQIVSFGVTTDRFPFVSSGGAVTKTAARLVASETVFCVLKLASTTDETSPSMRVYRPGEVLDESEPSTWTVAGRPGSTKYAPASLRIMAGQNASWSIDELKIGTTWDSVTQFGD